MHMHIEVCLHACVYAQYIIIMQVIRWNEQAN